MSNYENLTMGDATATRLIQESRDAVAQVEEAQLRERWLASGIGLSALGGIGLFLWISKRRHDISKIERNGNNVPDTGASGKNQKTAYGLTAEDLESGTVDRGLLSHPNASSARNDAAKWASYCVQCGHEVGVVDRYCGACGKSLAMDKEDSRCE